jgi:carboxypeptidase T
MTRHRFALKLTALSQATLAIAACVFLQTATAAENHANTRRMQEAEKAATNIYEAHFPSLDIARKAAISFHDKLLEANYEDGYLVFELEPKEMQQLRQFGFKLKPAKAFMEQRKKFITDVQTEMEQRKQAAPVDPGARAAASEAAAGLTANAAALAPVTIPGFACYETVEETFAQAQAFATNKPNLASWIDVGNSWEKSAGLGGFDMKVLKLTNSAITDPKPKLFVNSAIHAREYTTAPLNLEFARWLVNGYGVNADATWILDHHEVHLMLQTNPDGRKQAETGLSWRKNTNQAYCGATSNTRGADLNRNFSFTFNLTGGVGSSSDQCNLTYRGTSPASEPETQAIEGYVRSLWPDQRGLNQGDAAPRTNSGIHIDLHSYSQLVLWPWGTTNNPSGNATDLQTLGRKLAFFNGYTPQQSIGLYPTDGTSDAISYGELGVAAFTIELGTSFFQSCRTYTNTIKPNNLNALIYAAKVVRTPYITPAGPDISVLALGGTASTTGVQIGTNVNLTGTAISTRYSAANGTQTTQNIAGAEYYIDTPPWAAGAVPTVLAATDGFFNAKTEAVKGVISTSSLSFGKHIVYVRSKDVAGNWGPVTAAFLQVNP